MSAIYLPNPYEILGNSRIYNPFSINAINGGGDGGGGSNLGKMSIIEATGTQSWTAQTSDIVTFDTITADELGVVDLNNNGFVIPESMDGGLAVFHGFFSTTNNNVANGHHYIEIVEANSSTVVGAGYTGRWLAQIATPAVLLSAGEIYKLNAISKLAGTSPGQIFTGVSKNNKFSMLLIG